MYKDIFGVKLNKKFVDACFLQIPLTRSSEEPLLS